MRRLAVLLATTGILAGCGASGPSSSKVVQACLSSSNASRASCECAVSHAEAAGISTGKLLREMQDGTAINDQQVTAIAFACYRP